MNESTSYEVIMTYMPERLRSIMKSIDISELEKLMEIRLRAGGPVYYVYPDRLRYISEKGGLGSSFSESSYIVGINTIREIVDRLSHFSVHSCTRQLSEGFFVIGSGIRVGVSGGYSNTAGQMITDFCSLNFRISRCIEGCADDLFSEILGKNTIICGGVNSGKTTLIRELCRLSGSFVKTALIDERNEISCLSGGMPLNDVGPMTDILSNCPRSTGIITAVRTLSPEVIICDEAADRADAEAVISGMGCGVRFIVSAHAENYNELMSRKELSALVSASDLLVFLKGSSAPGQVKEIVRV